MPQPPASLPPVGQHRAEQSPLLPLAMAAKTAFDVATNLKLASEEWADNRALCAYCQTASLLSMASLLLALPEASRALRALRRYGSHLHDWPTCRRRIVRIVSH